MFIIDMVDSWDRTVMSWCVNCSKAEVDLFVYNLNNGLSDTLRNQVKSNEEYYFYYKEIEVSNLPTEDELKELMEPSEFELSMREPSNSGLTLEMIKDWDITKVPDMTDMFKECK